MKTLSALVSLLLSVSAFSQGKSDAVKTEKEVRKVAPIEKEKGKTVKEENEKAGLSGKEFGQSRAAAAKANAKSVKTGKEADAVIKSSKEDTKKTMQSISKKMTEARMILMQKLERKEITQAQFDEKLKLLMEFDKRQAALMKELN